VFRQTLADMIRLRVPQAKPARTIGHRRTCSADAQQIRAALIVDYFSSPTASVLPNDAQAASSSTRFQADLGKLIPNVGDYLQPGHEAQGEWSSGALARKWSVRARTD
jgi:hypothetical protein